MLDPFLHIDVAPVEHNSRIPHSEAKAKALQFSLEANDLQLFDLTTTPGSSSIGCVCRSLAGTPNAIWTEHGGPWCGGIRNCGAAVLECKPISHWLTTVNSQTHDWGAPALPATIFTHPALQCLISRKQYLRAGRCFLTKRKRWTIKPWLTLLRNSKFYIIFLFPDIVRCNVV